jgi:hypothetical protein
MQVQNHAFTIQRFIEMLHLYVTSVQRQRTAPKSTPSCHEKRSIVIHRGDWPRPSSVGSGRSKLGSSKAELAVTGIIHTVEALQKGEPIYNEEKIMVNQKLF